MWASEYLYGLGKNKIKINQMFKYIHSFSSQNKLLFMFALSCLPNIIVCFYLVTFSSNIFSLKKQQYTDMQMIKKIDSINIGTAGIILVVFCLGRNRELERLLFRIVGISAEAI
jgi:hypothetical protein